MIVVAKTRPKGKKLFRAYEKENLSKVFGGVAVSKADDVVRTVQKHNAEYLFWGPDTEKTSFIQWDDYCIQDNELGDIKTINPISRFFYSQNKDDCFDRWDGISIPVPPYFTYENEEEFYEKLEMSGMKPPFLVRVNNSSGGRESCFVTSKKQIPGALKKVHRHYIEPHYGPGIHKTKMCVKYIDTNERGSNYSYRIIVAGDQVITGYARVSDPKDWIAITKKFTPNMSDEWLYYNRKCQQFIFDNWDLIVKSVARLGLNFQGVDVIIDKDTQQPYFLEVQPGFSVGYFDTLSSPPPYYNPSDKQLIEFINDNYKLLEREIPLYTRYWLDKDTMFNCAFKAIKAKLNGLKLPPMHKEVKANGQGQ